MSKKSLLFVSVVCATATLNNAFPSPREMVRASWNSVYSYGKASGQQVLRHKVVALIAAALVTGGIIVYKSEDAQRFIKELLGFEVNKPGAYVIPSKPAKKSEEDTIARELDKTPLFDELMKVCPCDCEDENACISECEEECACCCEEDSE